MHPQRACLNPMLCMSKMYLFEAFQLFDRRSVRCAIVLRTGIGTPGVDTGSVWMRAIIETAQATIRWTLAEGVGRDCNGRNDGLRGLNCPGTGDLADLFGVLCSEVVKFGGGEDFCWGSF